MTLFKGRIIYTDKWNVRIILIVHAERVDSSNIYIYIYIYIYIFGRCLVEILTKASHKITEDYLPAKCRDSRLIFLFDNQSFLPNPLKLPFNNPSILC